MSRQLPKNLNKITNQKTPIKDFLRNRDIRANLPGRIRNGVMYVFFANEWITEKELAEFWPPVIVPNFTACLQNCDTTRLWIYQ